MNTKTSWRRTRKALRRASEPFLPATTSQHDHHKGVPRPTWRGRQHAIAAIASIPAGAAAIAIAPAGKRWPMAVYATTLTTTLTVSAVYHTLATSERAQIVGSRVDRASIYALIAGTTTPVIVYTQPKYANAILAGMWAVAALGAGARAAGKANKTSAAGYVALGWAAGVVGKGAWNTSKTASALLAVGGVAYTSGAVMYASGRPALNPRTYGHHEAFHTLTLVGFATHYAAVTILAAHARAQGRELNQPPVPLT